MDPLGYENVTTLIIVVDLKRLADFDGIVVVSPAIELIALGSLETIKLTGAEIKNGMPAVVLKVNLDGLKSAFRSSAFGVVGVIGDGGCRLVGTPDCGEGGVALDQNVVARSIDGAVCSLPTHEVRAFLRTGQAIARQELGIGGFSVLLSIRRNGA